MDAVDLVKRTVTVSHGFDRHSHELPFDYLVVAMGCGTNFHHLPGLEENAITMKSLGDAIHLRNRLIALLEEADTECAAGSRKPLMTFVVSGGGFSGVETSRGINDFVRESLKFYPNIDEKMVRVVVVSPPKPSCRNSGEDLGLYAQKKLTHAGRRNPQQDQGGVGDRRKRHPQQRPDPPLQDADLDGRHVAAPLV